VTHLLDQGLRFNAGLLLRSRMLRRLMKSLLAILLSLVAALAAAPDAAANVTVRVMTQNMFQGTNFDKVFAAATPEEFVAAVTATYEDVLATKPAERAAAVARTIARERPDIVAVLEAGILRTGTLPATDVISDQLKALLGELRKLGHNYEAIAILPGTDPEAPTLLGFDVRLTDRTVIIARAGLAEARLRTSNMQVQDFLVNNVLPLPVGPPSVSRAGWAAADITILGHKFRFVTMHLSPIPPFAIQQAQAAEAIRSAAHTSLPIVFAGDFNTTANNPANPTYPTYQILLGAGFQDAWAQKYPTLPGYTCCQSADLQNPVSSLDMRIDLVLTRGAIAVQDIRIVGDRASDRTPSGLWPSDHAGLVATLKLSGAD
jgi:endonuclease/exonuclease/phosphatase family metal-dependent hydrolase